jgi:hypothetical protein
MDKNCAYWDGGTARTGQGATWSSRFVTLPRSRPAIGPGVLRGVGDRVGRASRSCAELFIARIESGVFEVLCLPLDLLFYVLLVYLHRISTASTYRDLLHVHCEETRGAFVCKPPSTVECTIRVLRTVTGPDDHLEHRSLLLPRGADSVELRHARQRGWQSAA